MGVGKSYDEPATALITRSVDNMTASSKEEIVTAVCFTSPHMPLVFLRTFSATYEKCYMSLKRYFRVNVTVIVKM